MTTRTTISNLSRDLVEEIISRVPLKSMRAVRLTCRGWETLSEGRFFTEMHIGKATEAREGKSWMILFMDHNLYLQSLALNVDPSTEPKGKLISCLKDSDQVKIHEVFECEGLLLCIFENDTTRVVVWNPYLGQTRWIETRFTFVCPAFEVERYTYALGYQSKKKTSCRSHKLLRFMDYTISLRNLPVSVFRWYEIYNLESGIWKTIDVTPHGDICVDSHGVSLKGNTYWRAKPKNSRDDSNYIICFDFTRERFGPLLPLPFRALDDELVTLSCVREEKLAVLFQPGEDGDTEVWITDRIDTKQVSWIKFLTVDMDMMAPNSFISGTFFIDEEKKLAVVLDRHYDPRCYTVYIFGEAGYFKKLHLQECETRELLCHVIPYVPSLVQIKQPRGGKRKQQSKLETRRCTQKMLSLTALALPINQLVEARKRKRGF